MTKQLYALDLFSGCGGLTQGLEDAGFCVFAGVESDADAASVHRLNHTAKIYESDIRLMDPAEIQADFPAETSPLHLLAACPPCQGFSSLRRKNKKRSAYDSRNSLILEVVRFAQHLKPECIMLENVPGLQNYYLFRTATRALRKLGYKITSAVLDVADYDVPQHRERLIVLASLHPGLAVAGKSGMNPTVRERIEQLPLPELSSDPCHKLVTRHKPHISQMISLVPKNGGSRSELPRTLWLACHKKKNAGFHDVYGRLRWDDCSVTITGGCLNPSKGRFLHPEQNRGITPREAALLQTFPDDYLFLSPEKPFSKDKLALLIGNALPPRFCELQSRRIADHLRAGRSGGERSTRRCSHQR